MSTDLVHVYRGNIIESKHYGSIVVVDNFGNIISQIGESQREIFARSSMKLFQIIPAIEAGIMEKYDLASKDISLFCASHSGEDFHTETVMKNLEKADLQINALKCGVHPPRHIKTYENMLIEHREFSPIHNNCSGKHTGMLLTAKALNEEIANYYELNHPVQQRILHAISDICEYPIEKIQLGVDGCGVPVHCLPMYNIALGYANLVANLKYDPQRTKAIQTMVHSIINEPEMIGGTNRFCSDLVRICGGKLIAKAGAEGVYCIGHIDKKFGIAIKIDDGNSRASYPVAMEVLKQLDLITTDEYSELIEYALPNVLNARNEIVGKLKVNFKLSKTVKEEV
ncbi:L-asparaginase [Solibacillus sp. R5-41]|uniref:asparaginase n=1 Tax=Solibacillus sp. R5-41 TaxID=2048654 RepID=UPI000C12555D|nr:asparaginase [Solibacillus sp. R5-41]ATP41521.1 L-asparaginase [Solibacillus sp. R5-41]